VHYRYKDSVVVMPWIESWDFKGPKVLPEHATLLILDNVIYLDAIRKLGMGASGGYKINSKVLRNIKNPTL